MRADQEEIVGKKIVAVYADDKGPCDSIIFESSEGEFFKWSAYGDCCSSSWFEHFNGLDFLIGQIVNKIVEREFPFSDFEEDSKVHECLRQV